MNYPTLIHTLNLKTSNMKNLALICICILQYTFVRCQESAKVEDKSLYINTVNIINELQLTVVKESHGEYKYLSTNYPTFCYFLDTTNFELHYFFLLSHDSINIKLDNGVVEMLKTNYEEQKILAILDRENCGIFMQQESNVSLINDFDRAYDQAKTTLLKRDSLLLKSKESLRTGYYKLLSQASKLKRLNFLLNPYNPCSKNPDFEPPAGERSKDYHNEIKKLISHINTFDEQEISGLSFWLAPILINFSNYISKDFNRAFDIKFQAALNFNMLIKEAYLTTIMLDKINNENVKIKYLDRYNEICNNDEFKGKVNKKRNVSEEIYKNSDLLETELTKLDGTITSWSSILKNNRGNVVYIDFWASWCGGCKLNIEKISRMKKVVPNLIVIYVSKDEDKFKWQHSVKSWGFPNDVNSHYNLHPSSTLSKLLTEPSIPRATIIDQNGMIYTIDAEEPNSEALLKQILSLQNSQ